MSRHTLPIRVYYEDTDFSGNVYHAAYLHFFERGRTEFLRDRGIHHSELIGQGIAFAVRRMEIDFIAAAHIDDALVVETELAESSAVRLNLIQRIRRGDVLLTEAQVQVVAIKVGGGVARLPKALRSALSSSSEVTEQS